MKLTKRQLKKIIKEELEEMMQIEPTEGPRRARKERFDQETKKDLHSWWQHRWMNAGIRSAEFHEMYGIPYRRPSAHGRDERDDEYWSAIARAKKQMESELEDEKYFNPKSRKPYGYIQ